MEIVEATPKMCTSCAEFIKIDATQLSFRPIIVCASVTARALSFDVCDVLRINLSGKDIAQLARARESNWVVDVGWRAV